jgi:hypothetical protein
VYPLQVNLRLNQRHDNFMCNLTLSVVTRYLILYFWVDYILPFTFLAHHQCLTTRSKISSKQLHFHQFRFFNPSKSAWKTKMANVDQFALAIREMRRHIDECLDEIGERFDYRVYEVLSSGWGQKSFRKDALCKLTVTCSRENLKSSIKSTKSTKFIELI